MCRQCLLVPQFCSRNVLRQESRGRGATGRAGNYAFSSVIKPLSYHLKVVGTQILWDLSLVEYNLIVEQLLTWKSHLHSQQLDCGQLEVVGSHIPSKHAVLKARCFSQGQWNLSQQQFTCDVLPTHGPGRPFHLCAEGMEVDVDNQYHNGYNQARPASQSISKPDHKGLSMMRITYNTDSTCHWPLQFFGRSPMLRLNTIDWCVIVWVCRHSIYI